MQPQRKQKLQRQSRPGLRALGWVAGGLGLILDAWCGLGTLPWVSVSLSEQNDVPHGGCELQSTLWEESCAVPAGGAQKRSLWSRGLGCGPACGGRRMWKNISEGGCLAQGQHRV